MGLLLLTLHDGHAEDGWACQQQQEGKAVPAAAAAAAGKSGLQHCGMHSQHRVQQLLSSAVAASRTDCTAGCLLAVLPHALLLCMDNCRTKTD
jgi:hypothetical protein